MPVLYLRGRKLILFCMGLIIILGAVSCTSHSENKKLEFKDFPKLKIGFSTQNFQLAMPFSAAGQKELIEYASKEGYQFIELRDDIAKLSEEECRELAETAAKNKIEVIYEIHKNPIDTGYFRVFNRGLANTSVFPGPGVLRTLVSKSEFDTDSVRKGWNKNELDQLARLSDSCATMAKAKNIQFIVENFNEAFFGDSLTYSGLADFFKNTSGTGLQFDIGNPFRSSSREKASAEKVALFLPTLGNRWVTSHLKTILTQGGESQPFLTDNPLSIEKVVELMGKQNVVYCAIELKPVTGKQECFDNHAKSIQFLKEKGILK